MNQDLEVSMSQHKRDESISDYLDKDTSQADLDIKKKTKGPSGIL